jgi:diadenosine tetraphosphatase ApaH/serine/threonine PP2A family protein phosphatase
LIEKRAAEMGASDKAADAQLQTRHRDWLSALPPNLEFRNEIFLCHGTPTSDTTYWMEQVRADGLVQMTPIEDIEAAAEGIDLPLILCGHTHIPRVVRLRDGRLVVNPGSVGCPGYVDDDPVHHLMQSGTPDACYAVWKSRRSMGRQLSLRALRQPGRGRDGKDRKPTRVGECPGDGVGSIDRRRIDESGNAVLRRRAAFLRRAT